jgi:hypothetical protein
MSQRVLHCNMPCLVKSSYLLDRLALEQGRQEGILRRRKPVSYHNVLNRVCNSDRVSFAERPTEPNYGLSTFVSFHVSRTDLLNLLCSDSNFFGDQHEFWRFYKLLEDFSKTVVLNTGDTPSEPDLAQSSSELSYRDIRRIWRNLNNVLDSVEEFSSLNEVLNFVWNHLSAEVHKSARIVSHIDLVFKKKLESIALTRAWVLGFMIRTGTSPPMSLVDSGATWPGVVNDLEKKNVGIRRSADRGYHVRSGAAWSSRGRRDPRRASTRYLGRGNHARRSEIRRARPHSQGARNQAAAVLPACARSMVDRISVGANLRARRSPRISLGRM